MSSILTLEQAQELTKTWDGDHTKVCASRSNKITLTWVPTYWLIKSSIWFKEDPNFEAYDWNVVAKYMKEIDKVPKVICMKKLDGRIINEDGAHRIRAHFELNHRAMQVVLFHESL